MSYDSIREFIARLEKENELARITEPVSPILEISEITDRVSKSPGGGKALLFENVGGSDIPVLINAFGSWKRICLALEVENLDDIARDIERYLKITPPSTLMEKVKMLPLLFEAAHFPPRMTGSAPCQEVVHLNDEVDLRKLPIIQCWPKDAGRFITYPIVINRSADKKIRNVGLYRMQVFDEKTTAMHWHIHKDGAHFFHEYKKQNQRMEVAVAIGADPVVCYSASAPLPYGVDEFLLAGFIRKSAVPLVKCKTVDLEVPATAEIVLEGYIDPAESRLEGPFGDHTGYYSQDGNYPVLHVTAITHRRDPIYLTTIVGIPPQEDFYLGKATERIFLPLLQTQLPEIKDMNMPLEGVFHNSVIVSIDKRYPMQARKVMSALWGAGQMSFVKTIVVVDAEVDVHNEEEVLKLILNRVDFQQDLFFSEGILDVLNHASDDPLYGSKLGVDATSKVEGERKTQAKIETAVKPTSNVCDIVRKIFNEVKDCRLVQTDTHRPVLLIAYDKTRPNQSAEFIKTFFTTPGMESVTIFLLLEAHVDLSNRTAVLWKFFNNIDPKRDFHFSGSRLGVDVTRKMQGEGYNQDWPDEIVMSNEIKERVNKKWNAMFPE